MPKNTIDSIKMPSSSKPATKVVPRQAAGMVSRTHELTGRLSMLSRVHVDPEIAADRCRQRAGQAGPKG